jgi:large subunit ribosomal protein L3
VIRCKKVGGNIMKTLLGKKIGMTQIFAEDGTVIPVTVVEAGPETVLQVKTVETDGYNAVQVGFVDQKPQRVNKPMTGHFEKAGVAPKKHIAEFRTEDGAAYEVGQEITVAEFEEGMLLDVTGTSKGKGTQGNIKRHGHHRGPMSHGSKHKRLAGALAAGTYPSRVFKGNAGPGRMGRDTITVQNVVLAKVIADRNIMLIKGAVPGKKGGLVMIKPAVKASK